MNRIEALRKEFMSPAFHGRLAEECGKACVNCDADDVVEYHHIVPLEVGGTNKFSNIVPLCLTCHMAVHMGNLKKAQRAAKRRMLSGRKRICPEGYKEILNDYLECRIGKKECVERLGLNNLRLTDYVWFKEYIKEKSISRYRNNIDTINCSHNRGVGNGRELGRILHEDGTIRIFYWQDGEVIEATRKRANALRENFYLSET